MITIKFNGEKKQIDEKSTIAELLRSAKVESRFCAVELNLEIVTKERYETTCLVNDDKIEVVTLVGGG